MKLHSLHLVTIISEPVLLEKIENSLAQLGATGLTITEVRGEGSRKSHAGVVPSEKIKIECIANADTSEAILRFVASELFDHYSTIAYTCEISVIREHKFANR